LREGRGRRSALFRAFLALVLVFPPDTSSAAVNCATPGRDGSGSLTGIVNTYWPGTATAAAGTASITLGTSRGAAVPIASGDLLLVIQMQDAAIDSSNTDSYGDGVAGGNASGSTSLNNSGKYEYVRATGAVPVAGGTLTLQATGAGNGLLNTYTDANGTTTQGQRRFQVVRVPQYLSATLTSGLTAASWNGATGGILAIDVAGALDLGGAAVSVDGLGFHGGGARQLAGDTGGATTDYVQDSAKNYDGAKGEGIAGTPGWIYDAVTATTIASGTDYPNQSATINGGTQLRPESANRSANISSPNNPKHSRCNRP